MNYTITKHHNTTVLKFKFFGKATKNKIAALQEKIKDSIPEGFTGFVQIDRIGLQGLYFLSHIENHYENGAIVDPWCHNCFNSYTSAANNLCKKCWDNK